MSKDADYVILPLMIQVIQFQNITKQKGKYQSLAEALHTTLA